MELIKSSTNERFDLPDEFSPTVDFEIASDSIDRVVSVSEGVELPATEVNLALVSGATEMEVELKHRTGGSFFGTLSKDSQTINSMNDVVMCKIIDKIKGVMNDLDITIGDIADSSTFTWDFSSGGSVPNSSSTGWFLTTANFNGYRGTDYLFRNSPVFPVKFISDHSQMFWTISLYNFFKKVFDYYSVGYNFTSSTVLFGSETLGNIYMFIPAKFGCTDESYVNHTVVVNVSFAGTMDNTLNTSSYTDGLEQATLQGNKITITADADFTPSVNGSVSVTGVHMKTGGASTVNLNHQTDSDVRLIMLFYKLDSVIYEADLGSMYDSISGINKTTSLSPSISDSSVVLQLLATDEITFRYAFRFINYQFWTGNIGSSTIYRIDGVKSMADLASMNIGTNTPYISGVTTSSYIRASLTCVDISKPCRRMFLTYSTSGTIVTDTVSIPRSLTKTGFNVKDLIIDITNRFQLLYHIGSDNKLNISTFNTRYSSSYVNLSNAKNEKFTVNFLKFGAKKFSYKNNVGGITTLAKKYGGKEFNLGDVLEYDANGSNDNVDISLNSSVAHSLVYGDKLSEDMSDFIAVNPDLYYWGVGNNRQVEVDDLPIMYGFIYDQAMFDFRLARTEMVTLTDRNPEPYVTYVKNGCQQLLSNYAPKAFYYPTYKKNPSSPSSVTMLLGNNFGQMDVTTQLYGNFSHMLYVSGNYTIDIELLLSKTQLDSILSGYKVYIHNLLGDSVNEFKPMRIEGWIFDQDYCIVKATLKK